MCIRQRRGFYTLEAVIFLPLMILAVISLGYFIRLDSVWENIMYDALDESSYSASKAYDSVTELDSIPVIKKRILRDHPSLTYLKLYDLRDGYSDRYSDELTSYSVKAGMTIDLPAGFSRSMDFMGRIRYRGFKGLEYPPDGMGTEGLETDAVEDPVWIFPQSGIRYHSEDCTYVKASVRAVLLTSSLKRKYSPCDMCHSGTLPSGSLVFCFGGENTAYHRGDCRSIDRHTAVIDRSEAIDKGYSPCSKCGGGQ